MFRRLLSLMFAACMLVSNAHAMRCGKALVSKGDHFIEVLNKCGEPTYREDYTELLVTRTHHKLVTLEVVKPIVTTDWVYNFGPHQFMRLVRFKNGVVRGILTLGAGYRKSGR